MKCGIVHSIQAHTTKLMDDTVKASGKRMKHSCWKNKQNKFKEEVATLRTSLEKELEMAESDAEIAYSGQLRHLRGKINRAKNNIFMENRSANYMRDLENANILRAKVEVLEEDFQNIIDNRLDQAKDTAVGWLYIILNGSKDSGKAFDKGQAGKLPSNCMSWAFMKAIESRAHRKIDHTRTGTDQTDRKGMHCLHIELE